MEKVYLTPCPRQVSDSEPPLKLAFNNDGMLMFAVMKATLKLTARHCER